MCLYVLCKNIQDSAFVGADRTCNSIHNARNEQYETQNTSRVDGFYFLYRILCFVLFSSYLRLYVCNCAASVFIPHCYTAAITDGD